MAAGGGLPFGSYAELEVVLDRLTASPALRSSLGAAGQRYVDRFYHWPDVTARYVRFLRHVTMRR